MTITIDVYPFLFLLYLLSGCAAAYAVSCAVTSKRASKDPDPLADYANERLADLDSREVCCLVAQAILEGKEGYKSSVKNGDGSIYLPGIEFSVHEFSCYATVGEKRTPIARKKLHLFLSVLKAMEGRQAVNKAREAARQGEIL
jgi:hypothetical protein